MNMRREIKEFKNSHPNGYSKEERLLWQRTNRHRIREYSFKGHLKKRYGMTPEEYNNLFIKQEGKCAICFRHQTQLKRRLSVDHNHITGKIRGLLCYHCNCYILGTLENYAHLLVQGKIYLEVNRG